MGSAPLNGEMLPLWEWVPDRRMSSALLPFCLLHSLTFLPYAIERPLTYAGTMVLDFPESRTKATSIVYNLPSLRYCVTTTENELRYPVWSRAWGVDSARLGSSFYLIFYCLWGKSLTSLSHSFFLCHVKIPLIATLWG